MSTTRSWVRPLVRSMRAYEADVPPAAVKLDANESPLDLPDEVKSEILAAIRSRASNRYPDPSATRLRELLAAHVGVGPECIVVGNGSDELLTCLALVFGAEQAVCLRPAFAMYSVISNSCGTEAAWVDLTDDFDLDVDAMLAAGERGARPVYVGYPNNPTGRLFSRERMECLVHGFPGPVVVDEAYHEFAGQSMLDMVGECANLVVLRTFSKAFGLAGWRLGYMIAPPDVAAEVNKVRLPYNVNAMTQIAGCVCMERKAELLPRLSEIISQRDVVLSRMSDMDGLTVFPTDANFILFRTGLPAAQVFDGLLARGILVRNLDDGGRLAGCLRVTVSTEDENAAFLAALSEVI